MTATDAALEAARIAQAERRYRARLTREAQHAGNPTLVQAITDAWEPIRLFQREMNRYGRYERQEPEGVVVND